MDLTISIIFFLNGIASLCNFIFIPVSPLRQSICLACLWIYGMCLGYFIRKKQAELMLGMAAKGMLDKKSKRDDSENSVAVR